MAERIDQRICIKFCWKLGHSSVETTRLIRKAFQDESMSDSQIKFWYRRFKLGQKSCESDPRPGRPSTSRHPENIERVRNQMKKNCKFTIRELSECLSIPRTTVSEILTDDLGMKRLTPKSGWIFPAELRNSPTRDIIKQSSEDSS